MMRLIGTRLVRANVHSPCISTAGRYRNLAYGERAVCLGGHHVALSVPASWKNRRENHLWTDANLSAHAMYLLAALVKNIVRNSAPSALGVEEYAWQSADKSTLLSVTYVAAQS